MKFIHICAALSLCILQDQVKVPVVQGIEPFSVSRILREKKARKEASSSSSSSSYLNLNADAQALQEVQELYLDQRLDHFASHPDTSQKFPHTFSQRYFYSDVYVKGHEPHLRGGTRTAPTAVEVAVPTYALLCVGGEGPAMDKTVLTNSVHCSGDMMETAKILHEERGANVHLFALEHRYYGKSYPSFGGNDNDNGNGNEDVGTPESQSPVTNENLVFLSSRQALADLAHFVEYAKETYLKLDTNTHGVVHFGEGLSSEDSHEEDAKNGNVPFITFGGSYPGMLAAWSRLKYPHLIYAAVSNSAPIQVVLDFKGYKDVVARDFANEMVGGSTQCLDIIQKAHEEIADVLFGNERDDDDENESNIERIATLFQICNPEDLKDEKSVRSFLGDGAVFLDIQSNDPSCDDDYCNIEKFCNFLTEESSRIDSTPMEALGKLTQNISKKNGGDECNNISWEDMIEYMSDTGADAPLGERSWTWQTCTEVGFYQTCELNSTCPFGKGYHTIDADYEICERAFGIDAEFVKQNVDDTLNYYGGWDIESSRILSVNGDIDPWSDMSYSNSGKTEDGKRKGMDSYWSIGASHHFWTHAVKDSDGLGIMKTREFIYNWVLDLLDEFESEFDTKKEKEVASEIDMNMNMNMSLSDNEDINILSKE